MKRIGAALIGAALAFPVLAGAQAPPANRGARADAKALSARLASFPRIDTSTADARDADAFQPILDEMALVAALLEAELAAGRGRAETRSLFERLRALRQQAAEATRVLEIELPEDEVRAFEARFHDLSRYYTRP